MATQRIFISYRRQDSGTAVERITDVLATVFGPENVFRDIVSIDAGVRFDIAVEQSISRCNVFLAVIGSSWLSVSRAGDPRLDRSDDPVRVEIEVALRRGVAIVPVLVNEAMMPTSESLPEGIRGLSRINAFTLGSKSFHDDLRRLCGSLHDYDPEAFARKLSPATWDDLVVPEDCRRALALVLDEVRLREKIRIEWGVGKHDSPEAMTIAFCGPAGCGKTLAARIVAHELRLDLYQVNLEEARLRWKAGDRLPIDWLFRRAVATPVLLQLRDTIGALSARLDVAGEPGMLAASLIRRLQDRDAFSIVTTRSVPDREAGVWRFDHVVTFPFPDGQARNAIWEREFPPELPCADIECAALAQHPLSGDSIRRAIGKAALIAARDNRVVTMKDCFVAIQLEGGDTSS